MDYLKDLSTIENILKNGGSSRAQPGSAESVSSKRFGTGAYLAEVSQYPTVEKAFSGEFNQYLKPYKTPEGYNAIYTRTQRDLGKLPTTDYYGSTRISPQHADLYLDVADEFNRIDPNVYELDVSKVEAPKISSAITGRDDMARIFDIGTPELSLARATPKPWDSYQGLMTRFYSPELFNGTGIDDVATAQKAGWTQSMIDERFK